MCIVQSIVKEHYSYCLLKVVTCLVDTDVSITPTIVLQPTTGTGFGTNATTTTPFGATAGTGSSLFGTTGRFVLSSGTEAFV